MNTAQWAVGFLLSAVGLARSPDVLWTRWLVYPVAAILLFLSVVVVTGVMGKWKERIVANAVGVEIREERPLRRWSGKTSLPLPPWGCDPLGATAPADQSC